MKKIVILTQTLLSLVLVTGANTAFAQTFDIKSSGDFGNSHAGYPSSNAVDGNTGFSSRWASTFEGGSANLFVDLGSRKRVDNIGVSWGRGDQRSYKFEVRTRGGTDGSWKKVFSGESSGRSSGIENYNVDDTDARQVRIKVFSNSARTNWADVTEFEVYGTSGPSDTRPTPTAGDDSDAGDNSDNSDNGGGNFNLNSNDEPWENFDLRRWSLDSPAPRSNDGCKAERTWDHNWNDRDPISSASRRFFFTHSDGGMRFTTRIDGETTNSNCNSGFVRSELREMLRAGNRSVDDTGVTRNNWKLGYQPGTNSRWGGVNGRMDATLRVNRVTTTGDSGQVGRVIIGQIHAGNDEPLRLYYRKRSGQSRGCIYFSHEIRDSDDVDFFMIGNESCTSGPSNGIELNELFSYTIENDDEDITVIIRRGDRNGSVIARRTINMNSLNSGYDRSDEWMYFKAGAYTQNNSGRGSDGDIVTFYRLSVSHD